MDTKENLEKKMDMDYEEVKKSMKLLVQKYYASGYAEGVKDKTVDIQFVPCNNGYQHTLRINRNGFISCTKCLQKFRVIAESEVKRTGIVFV